MFTRDHQVKLLVHLVRDDDFMKKGSGIIKKILESAIANAEHNEGADIDELRVQTVLIDQGPTHKRFRARARGRVNHIMKRTSHITLTVSDI